MIGVFDKKSKTLKLVESPHIFKMDQHIKGLETKVTVDNMYKDLSYLEKRKILVDAFGTKRTRTTIRQLMSNKIDPSSAMDVDQVAADLIGDKIKKDGEKKRGESESEDAPAVENIPPYNPKATKPAKIFDIDNSILLILIIYRYSQYSTNNINNDIFSRTILLCTGIELIIILNRFKSFKAVLFLNIRPNQSSLWTKWRIWRATRAL